MCNYEASEVSNGHYFYHTNLDHQRANVPLSNSINKYVYVKKNLNPSHGEPKAVISKVLVNPHFNKTVFVNPNFNIKATINTNLVPKIHVNPKVQKLNINLRECTNVQKIHVNPNVLRNIPATLNNQPDNLIPETRTNFAPRNDTISNIFSTKMRLIHSPVEGEKIENKLRKRRSSVRSKFKIIKSSILEDSLKNRKIQKRRTSVRSKYKIIKSTCSHKNYPQVLSKVNKSIANKFKVDNTRSSKTVSPHKSRKYVYLNRFLSIGDIARSNLLKHNGGIKKSSLINISGILYKKSTHSLRITSDSYKKMDELKKVEQGRVSKSKFKFIRKPLNKKASDIKILKSKMIRVSKIKKNVSPGKLRKCNIPCPYYRKFGRCKGEDNGKCYRKHDRDQIALCTKFLQGACVDKKCFLSHNVSPEKMPTCKFYLEGSCSRDDCPYLHVRISPKADICKDFLEGFCKKASQCDKRHQFLCPDYEKNGSCLKQRCPYPHGKMVRKYSVFNKNKFAKKSSNDHIKETKNYNRNNEDDALNSRDIRSSEPENVKLSKNCEINVKGRYYIEQHITAHEDKYQEAILSDQKNSDDVISCDQECGIKSRPKLGRLPSFIAFEEI